MHYLDRNEFQFDLPPQCLQLLENSATSLLTHYSRSFERNTKSPITEHLSAVFKVPEENILLGYGCEDLLTQMVQYFVKKGDRVLVAQYAWWYYKKIADQVEGVTLEFPMHRDGTTFRIDIQDVIDMYEKHHPKVILLANPNNPTGDFIHLDDLETLIHRCPDAIIIVDESYWGYHDKGNDHPARFLKDYPNVIILRTFSKYYGLAGVRIGFGFVHSTHSLLIRCSHRYLGFNRLAEEMALAAMDSPDHYEQISQIIEAEKQRYYTKLRPIQGVRVYDSKTNFVLVAVPEATVPELKKRFKETDVLVRFFENGGLQNHFRVSVAKPHINDLVFQCIQDAASRS